MFSVHFRWIIIEFTPYIFQILSQLLALHSEAGIPDIYMTLLQPLLQPAQWENYANIPALVNFLSSFLSKSFSTIIQQGQLPAFLGIFQKLVASKANDHHGMNFCKAIFEYVPTDALAPFIKNLFVIMMTRLFQSKTPKFTKCFFDFMVHIILLDKPGMLVDDIIQTIESVQSNLFPGLLENILVPELALISSRADKTNAGIAMTKLLTQSQIAVTLPQW
jgi:exportin-2 (importin alpha re-exporter)